jgi:hypothetical protein
MTRRLHALVALVAGIALAQSATTGRAQQPGPDRDFVGNEVLVQFAPGRTPAPKPRHAAAFAASELKSWHRLVTNAAISSCPHPARPRGGRRRARHRGRRAVTFAEPNWIYTHGSTSNDPYYTNGSLWGMYGATTTPANQFGSGAAAAWANGHVGASNVYVGIIDEGVMPHNDFGANVWVNPGETPATASTTTATATSMTCAAGTSTATTTRPTTARRTITARTSPAPSARSAAIRSASPA